MKKVSVLSARVAVMSFVFTYFALLSHSASGAPCKYTDINKLYEIGTMAQKSQMKNNNDKAILLYTEFLDCGDFFLETLKKQKKESDAVFHLSAFYTNRGLAHSAKGEYAQAIADHTKAIELNPKAADPVFYLNRGMAYKHKGENGKAIQNITKALELKLGHQEGRFKAFYHLGALYSQKGDHAQAIEFYTKAIGLKPDVVSSYVLRGWEYFEADNNQKAKDDFEKALELQNNLDAAYAGMAVIFLKQGKQDEAVSAYKKAIELNPLLDGKWDDLTKQGFTGNQINALQEVFSKF